MSCLCLGPKRSGKTHLLNALNDPDSINDTTYSIPTMGTSLFTIRFPQNSASGTSTAAASSTVKNSTTNQKSNTKIKKEPEFIQIMEIGGSMAPMWKHHYDNVKKIIYVVDTSNLCQISAAGVLLYTLLADPKLQKIKLLLVLSKMDYAYRQMRNEALLMLQMSKLQKEIPQEITIVEASAVTKMGLDKIYDWLKNA